MCLCRRVDERVVIDDAIVLFEYIIHGGLVFIFGN